MQPAPTSTFFSPDFTRHELDFRRPERSELSQIFRNHREVFKNAADLLLALPREEFQRPPLRRR